MDVKLMMMMMIILFSLLPIDIDRVSLYYHIQSVTGDCTLGLLSIVS